MTKSRKVKNNIMNEQKNRQYPDATCRGAYALGTACGDCKRCDVDPLNPKNVGKKSACCGAEIDVQGRYAGAEHFEYCKKCHRRQDLLPKETVDTTQDGKVIKKTEHQDGRKDVHIEVNTIDAEDADPATLNAKEVIEKEVFPRITEALVLVVVLHKPTNQHSERIVKVPHVRKYAEACVREYNKALSVKHGVAGMEAPKSEFVVVEHHLTNGTITVSTL